MNWKATDMTVVHHVEVVEGVLKTIRDAKRPTPWQVTKEFLSLFWQTVLVGTCVWLLNYMGHLPLWAGIIGWLLVVGMVIAQVKVLGYSVRARHDLFKFRDDMAKAQAR